uniref:Syntaxin-binding protein 4 isoform X2 n=1 Tax=Petromyzon marinus TaxID=7757 RepID=A0AAJ7TUM9_PETMA|nr:syntaxin-binding protein 4 isoform X2 [Petromyzon marinus]
MTDAPVRHGAKGTVGWVSGRFGANAKNYLEAPSYSSRPWQHGGCLKVTRTIMGPHGINRAAHRIVLSDCENGLGVKVIGGVRESGEEFGVYVKRVLPGGMAALDGRLRPGDQILEVNGESLLGVTNDRREFAELLEKYASNSDASSAHSSPTPPTLGKFLDSTSSASSSRSPSPLLSPKDSLSHTSGAFPASRDSRATTPSSPQSESGAIQVISLVRTSGLGITLMGGTNRPDGPMVYVQEVLPGGDCHKDGRVRPGDQLVAINKESLVGITHEDAKGLLTRTKLRTDAGVEIAFIRGKGPPYSSALHSVALYSSQPGIPSTQPKQGNSRQGLAPIPVINSAGSTHAGGRHLSRKLSLDPHVRLKVDKLELALRYLGVEAREEQQEALREALQVDSRGTVKYGDFVRAARQVFCLQLEEMGPAQGAVLVGTSELAALLEPLSPLGRGFGSDDGEAERLRRERDEALFENHSLKARLSEVEHSSKDLHEELQKAKQEAQVALEESRALRNRVHLAEVATRQAHSMEQDYEEVVRLLEIELSDVKGQLIDLERKEAAKDEVLELRKRIAVLDCQLRKSEMTRKTFEVSTDKLLQFVETVQEVLSSLVPAQGQLALTRGETVGVHHLSPVVSRGVRNGTASCLGLAAEAREISKSIRGLIEADCLPYGWEEAYTADGIKYFINHVTQTTSWVHPVTSTLSLPLSDDAANGVAGESTT